MTTFQRYSPAAFIFIICLLILIPGTAGAASPRPKRPVRRQPAATRFARPSRPIAATGNRRTLSARELVNDHRRAAIERAALARRRHAEELCLAAITRQRALDSSA